MCGQAVVGFAATGTAHDGFGQEAVADIRIHGAQEAALRPLAFTGQGGVDDAKHVFPRHVGPQAAHVRHPVQCGFM